MPPKPAPGKKGADEVDLSDVASLPPLNSVTFTLLFGAFFSQATREKAQKYLNDHISQDRVKTLTRDEIITFGKAKQFILEPGQAQTLPADDPRAKMSEADQLAKAAFERLFELQVVARRTKKERLTKAEEEAKTSGQPLAVDSDLLDVIFQLVDFPQSKEEALAFAKLNATVNLVLEAVQKFRGPQPDDEDDLVEQLHTQEQPVAAGEEGSDSANEEKTRARLEQLLAARASSGKSSVLRHLAHLELEFVNWPSVELKPNEHGEDIEVRKEPEHAFSDGFNHKLEHFGALYVKYQRFREKVTLMPLAPDQAVMRALADLQLQSEDYKDWLSNVENLIQSIEQQLQSNADPNTTELLAAQRKEAEEEKASKAVDEEERRRAINECRDKLKESRDDTFFIPNYSLDAYRASFLPHKEGQNSVAAIMSAMVSQIARENAYDQVFEEHAQKLRQAEQDKSLSTADDTIDDLFDS